MPRTRRTRDPRDLPVEHVRDRMSSYIYGNITVLSAAIAVNPEQIHHGAAVLTVLATAVLTYLAHVLAHVVAHGFGDQGSDAQQRESAATIVRNANPIATSGLIPAVLYAAAWAGWVPAGWSQVAAIVILVARIGLVGVFMQRFSGRRPTFLGLWGGVVLAAVAFVIGLVKVVLTH
uniref:MAPEG family protein n=1 Tax=Neobacillus citreus TaxID=2833578 RepID=A0A942SY09_9BACI